MHTISPQSTEVWITSGIIHLLSFKFQMECTPSNNGIAEVDLTSD